VLLVVHEYSLASGQCWLLTVQAPAAKRGSKAAKVADDGDAAGGDTPAAGAEEAPEAQPVAKDKAKGKAAKAAPGHVKLGAETGGAALSFGSCTYCWC
jgi:hypothetical protein